MKQSFKYIVNEYLNGIASKIKNETLILSGKNDRETPPYSQKKLCKLISNSSLIFIENAGHFSFVNNPNFFNSKAFEFLKGDKSEV
jgi:pimeloyl-ACP methyl ester carboxylesterase